LGYGDEAKLGQHAQVRCTRVACQGSELGALAIGWVAWDALVLRKCLCNAHNALCNRHCVKQPEMTADLLPITEMFLAAVAEVQVDYFSYKYQNSTTWLAKWPLAKQLQFLQSMLFDHERPEWVRSFVKWEILSSLSWPTKARLIQGYSNLVSQLLSGPLVSSLQAVLSHHVRHLRLNEYVDLTFACGLDAAGMVSWAERVQGAVGYYERDGKTWDALVQHKHFLYRDMIYRFFDPELADIMAKSVDVAGIVRGRSGFLSYRVAGTVKSGHNDTTLWNSILNGIIAAHAFTELRVRASVIVTGDDMLAAVYDIVHPESVAQLERDCGVNPEFRMFKAVYSASFVSAVWVNDGVKIGFIPKPGRLFARLWWSVKPPPRSRMAQHLNSIALGLYPACQDVPIVKIWLRKAMNGMQSVDTGRDWWRDFGSSDQKFSPGIYNFFALRYDVTVEQLYECESFLEALPFEAGLVVHPVLTRVIEVDLADVKDRVMDSLEAQFTLEHSA